MAYGVLLLNPKITALCNFEGVAPVGWGFYCEVQGSEDRNAGVGEFSEMSYRPRVKLESPTPHPPEWIPKLCLSAQGQTDSSFLGFHNMALDAKAVNVRTVTISL